MNGFSDKELGEIIREAVWEHNDVDGPAWDLVARDVRAAWPQAAGPATGKSAVTDALRACVDELHVIHSQFGDQENARAHCASIRLGEAALNLRATPDRDAAEGKIEDAL